MSFYTIFFRNLHVEASIGIHEHERKTSQPLLVSFAMFLTEPADKTDSISNVVDYDFAHAVVRKCAAERHWDLQETLCAAIAEQCLDQEQVLGAIVQTAKVSAYPDVDEVGCRMARLGPDMPENFQWWLVNV